MIELNLHGNLAKYYGKKVSLNTETPRNALNLLTAQNQGFKRDLLSQQHLITLNNRELNENNFGVNLDASYKNAQIHITPVIQGGIAGAVSLVTWISVGLAVASVAFSLFMSRNMKVKTSAERAQDNTITNNTYTSVENKVGQGRPVPILLGEMKVGSNVGSLGIDTTNNKDALDVVS
ncbi:tail assembly protein [Escherichia coli]|uniref:tail assembly protein n=1 Tax=Escherichia coli TaxID=562 RepID=UPI0010CBDEBA|nr:tail assembly protein [Escherichia coli]GDJ07931.1 phage tail assembly protein [Escherichia coli]